MQVAAELFVVLSMYCIALTSARCCHMKDDLVSNFWIGEEDHNTTFFPAQNLNANFQIKNFC